MSTNGDHTVAVGTGPRFGDKMYIASPEFRSPRNSGGGGKTALAKNPNPQQRRRRFRRQGRLTGRTSASSTLRISFLDPLRDAVAQHRPAGHPAGRSRFPPAIDRRAITPSAPAPSAYEQRRLGHRILDPDYPGLFNPPLPTISRRSRTERIATKGHAHQSDGQAIGLC
jgi:hypothetical protein